MNLNGIRKALVAVACVLAVISCARAASAAETLKIRNVSKSYDLEVQIAACGGASQDGDANRCSGPARVRVFRKGSETPLQVLRLPNVELYKDTAAFSPETSKKPRGVYAEEYSFVFDDFNFDGREDLAVCNGRNGGYGGPSYTVFLFDNRAGRFVENRRLSALAEGDKLGLFFPDPKRRTLTAYSKSGCCLHWTEIYKVINDRPVLVEEITEDATTEGGAPEGFVLVTTRKRVGRRWVVTKKKQKLEEDAPDEQN